MPSDLPILVESSAGWGFGRYPVDDDSDKNRRFLVKLPPETCDRICNGRGTDRDRDIVYQVAQMMGIEP